jgi:co-chaperonin GroES (HSP10)
MRSAPFSISTISKEILKMALRPAGHRLLVSPDKVEDMKGSIHLAPSTIDRQRNEKIWGTVVKIGTNAFKAFDSGEPWCAVGDHVCFAKFAGFTVTDPDQDGVQDSEKTYFRVLNDEDVILVHTKEA